MCCTVTACVIDCVLYFVRSSEHAPCEFVSGRSRSTTDKIKLKIARKANESSGQRRVMLFFSAVLACTG
jgi:hypothetical protein